MTNRTELTIFHLSSSWVWDKRPQK